MRHWRCTQCRGDLFHAAGAACHGRLADVRPVAANCKLEPGPIVPVSSQWKGQTNIMTMGWHMMLGFSPALLACYLWDGNHSFDMIRRSRECAINLPTADMIDSVVGSCRAAMSAGAENSSRRISDGAEPASVSSPACR